MDRKTRDNTYNTRCYVRIKFIQDESVFLTQFTSYDSHGIFSAPRALFMFRSFGHQSSSIIDGGLPRWVDEDLPLETIKPTEPRPTHYPAPKLNEEAIKSTLYLSLFYFFFSDCDLCCRLRSGRIQFEVRSVHGRRVSTCP